MSAESGSGEAASRRSSVLVATSDSATRNLLRQILHVGAVDLVDAVDGVEALALARRLDLDLIVLDAFLAVMDGISVCGRIRTLTDVDQPPILMVGLISERAVELALSAGADETLSKPLSPTLIRSRTRALLTRRREEKRLHLIQRALDAAPVGITLLDARSSEYSVTHANPAFLELTGHSPEEILGRNLRLLTGPETDVTTMTELRDALAEGRRSRVLLKNYRKDGQPFWNDLATAPVLDEAGRLTHYVAVQHDVTDQVEAPKDEAARAIEETVFERTRDVEASLMRVERRRRFAETILNSMVSAILTTDSSGSVTFANLSALRTLAASAADCVGRSVIEIFGHNEGVAEVVEGTIPEYPEHRLDFPLTTPGGTRIYVGVSIVHAPPEFRDEVRLIFLFRNLAETVLDEGDPRLARLEETGAEPGHARRVPSSPAGEGGPAAPSESMTASPSRDAKDGRGETGADDPQAPRRRTLLSLRYTQPAGLVRAVVEELAAERGEDGSFVRVETSDDVPEALLDRQQASEALRLLLAGTLDRCDDPRDVRVRISRTEAAEGRPERSAPAVRIEVLYRRAQITDRDLSTEGEVRPAYRRADLAEAEKLIEANGGRLHRPRRDSEEQVLTVLLPAAG
ncbi:MAG: PAS domain-containing protein [Acidobacteriota bacterium]